jgi:hypothetical protein
VTRNHLLCAYKRLKGGVCDDFFCASLWGSSPHAYSYRPSVGASGGLLVVWDTVELRYGLRLTFIMWFISMGNLSDQRRNFSYSISMLCVKIM